MRLFLWILIAIQWYALPKYRILLIFHFSSKFQSENSRKPEICIISTEICCNIDRKCWVLFIEEQNKKKTKSFWGVLCYSFLSFVANQLKCLVHSNINMNYVFVLNALFICTLESAYKKEQIVLFFFFESHRLFIIIFSCWMDYIVCCFPLSLSVCIWMWVESIRCFWCLSTLLPIFYYFTILFDKIDKAIGLT